MAEYGLSANEFNTAVYVFAHYLGIDLEKEQSLLSIAETALRTLPDGWSLGIGDGDNEGIPYFFNEESGESVWKHPKETIYLKKVKEERRKLENEADDKKKKQQQHKAQDGGNKSMSSTSFGNRDGSKSNNNNNNNKKTSLVPVNPEDEVLMFDDFELDEEETPVKPTKPSATTHAVSEESTGTSKNNAAKGQQQQQSHTKESISEGKNNNNNKKRQDDFDDDEEDDDDYDDDSMVHHPYPKTAKKDEDAKDKKIPETKKKEEVVASNSSAVSPKSSFPLGKGKDKRPQHFDDDDDDESMGEIEGDFFSEDDEEEGTKSSHAQAAGKSTSTGNVAAAANTNRSSTSAGATAKSTDHWPSATTATTGSTAAAAISVDVNKTRASYSNYSPSAKEGLASGASSKNSGGSDAVPWEDWDSEQDNSTLPSPAKTITNTLPPAVPAKSPQSAGSPSGATMNSNDSHSASPAQAKSRGSTRVSHVMVESDDVTSLRAENKELEDCISGMQRKFDMELENLRSTQAKLERTVEKEKAGREAAEAEVTRVLSQPSDKGKDNDNDNDHSKIEEMWAQKVRDMQKKTRADAEEEHGEKMKTAERKWLTEQTQLKAELDQAKRDAIQLGDALKDSQRVSQTQMGDVEKKAKVDEKLRQELESQLTAQTTELRKLREDNSGLTSRLASALQSAQAAVTECETAKASAHTAISEAASNHAALVTATNRIQQLDNDSARYQADLMLLRREGETQAAELRRLQGLSHMDTDKLATVEAELKWLQSSTQVEIQRQSGRIAELEALNMVLRTQLDAASTAEATNVRDLQRQLDRAENDTSRLRDKVADLESKAADTMEHTNALEKESRSLQDLLAKRDRSLRDDKRKSDDALAHLESIRASLETELAGFRSQSAEDRVSIQERERRHQLEVESLKRDIAEKVPQIVATAVERVEGQLAVRVEKEVSSVRLRYEQQNERMKRELLELQGGNAEREARQRAAHADEKSELDRLRYLSQRLQRRVAELEAEVDEMRVHRKNSLLTLGSGMTPGAHHGNGRVPVFEGDRELPRSISRSRVYGVDDFDYNQPPHMHLHSAQARRNGYGGGGGGSGGGRRGGGGGRGGGSGSHPGYSSYSSSGDGGGGGGGRWTASGNSGSGHGGGGGGNGVGPADASEEIDDDDEDYYQDNGGDDDYDGGRGRGSQGGYRSQGGREEESKRGRWDGRRYGSGGMSTTTPQRGGGMNPRQHHRSNNDHSRSRSPFDTEKLKEEALAAMTMSLVQSQLSQMKQQLLGFANVDNSYLALPAPPTVSRGGSTSALLPSPFSVPRLDYQLTESGTDRRPGLGPGLGHNTSSLHASEQAIHRMYRPMHDLALSSVASSSSHPISSTTITHGPGVSHTPHASTHPTPSDIHNTNKVSFSPESILYTTPAATGGAGAEASSGRFFGASTGTLSVQGPHDNGGSVSGSGIDASGVSGMGHDEGGSSFVAADMSVGAAHNTSTSVPSTTTTTTPMASTTNNNNNNKINNVTAGMTSSSQSSGGGIPSSSTSSSSSSYLLEGIVDDSSGYQEGYWRNKYTSGNSMNNSVSYSGGRGYGTSSGVKTMR